MDAKAANEARGRSKMKKKQDSWKLPKISVDQIYKKRSFRIFPSLNSSYVIKDFETTAMGNLFYSEMALRRLISGETTYFQGNFRSPKTTKWDEVQVPKAADQEGSGSKIKKRPDTWKLPKIPVNQVYKKKSFRIFPSLHQNPSYVIKDFEKTITLDFTSQDNGIVCKAMSIMCPKALKEITLGKTTYFQGNSKIPATTEWDEVQVPQEWTTTTRGVCNFGKIMDAKVADQERVGSKIKKKKPDRWKLPKIPIDHVYKTKALRIFPRNTMDAKVADQEGSGTKIKKKPDSWKLPKVPIDHVYKTKALRIFPICKAMVDLNSEALEELTLGKTTYFQLNCGSLKTTKWDEVQVPEEWTTSRV
ncbi:hypothetical protein Cgig2_022044 [Carnegiea gigantea]|uniref:Uncharacterized protein n=1 Tax=Carnegiea gigantea TaxID=171969 RepID=A0A9Q1KT93_9CARY|nr:hypothetical protein Cgig2_022044 [Carnegiea gigantea]